MALIARLAPFKANKTGEVKGQSMITANKDGLDIIEFSFAVTAPRDPSTGQANGRRAYKPIVFTWIVDKSFPQMAQILDTNDTIESLKFEFFMPREQGNVQHKGGREILTVEYTFTTVHLASLEFRQLNVHNPELAKYEMTVTASAVFESLNIDYKNNGSTSMTAAWSTVGN